MTNYKTIRHAIEKECRRISLTDWCENWEFTVDVFYKYLDAVDKILCAQQEPNEPLCGLTNAQLGRLVRNSYIEGYEDGQNGKPSLEKNEPLTLDELREMKGEPVWLHTFSLVQKKTNIAEWAILEAVSSVGAVFLRTGCNSRLTKWFTNYDKTWLAYRCKPEQEG